MPWEVYVPPTSGRSSAASPTLTVGKNGDVRGTKFLWAQMRKIGPKFSIYFDAEKPSYIGIKIGEREMFAIPKVQTSPCAPMKHALIKAGAEVDTKTGKLVAKQAFTVKRTDVGRTGVDYVVEVKR